MQVDPTNAEARAIDWLIRQRDCAYLRRLWRLWSPGWAFTEDDFAPVRQAFASPAVAHAATRYYRSLFTPQRAATRAFYARLRRPLGCGQHHLRQIAPNDSRTAFRKRQGDAARAAAKV